jgi:N-acetylglucosaminyldiphosphoundecaprenol N-acetyl-beta-D-mannosaminyltransferase
VTTSEAKAVSNSKDAHRFVPTDSMPAAKILGVRVHSVSMPQVMHMVTAMASGPHSHQIVTVNPEFIMEARRNDAFRHCLNEASLAVPDGIGVVLAQRMQGVSTRGRIAGVDIVEGIAELSARNGFGVFLLGAAPGIAELAAEKLQQKYPGLRVVGTYAGSPRPEEEDQIVARVLAAKPHFLFVAYGAPRQDLWIQRNLTRLQVPVAMGVGGTFDFIAGIAVRAPRLLQRIGLEWLYRLAREPRRWRRMLALPRFAVAVLTAQFLQSPFSVAPDRGR